MGTSYQDQQQRRGLSERVGFALLVTTMSIFVIVSDFNSLLPVERKNESSQQRFVPCALPVGCGGRKGIFGIECVQSASANPPSRRRYAVVSMLMDMDINPFVSGQIDLSFDIYVEQLRVLGYMIRNRGNLTCSVDMLVMIKADLAPRHIHRLNSVGWGMVIVREIPSPRAVIAGITPGHRFVHMFTKLQIFNLTAYDAVLYLDADTLVRGSINDLFEYYVPQMLARDVRIGWSKDLGNVGLDHFGRNNAGVLLLRPSSAMLQNMTYSMNHIHFNAIMSEQGFLNTYFTPETELVFPAEQYNCMSMHPCFLGSKNTSILHFTNVKPESILWKFNCWQKGVLEACNEWSAFRRDLDASIESAR
jgi:hypothetical protein